ncbi:MAG TPA: M50 family metallopeptidase [Rhodanobacteraceae bacterium]|nr:M50 family metallopeptidase [Rhodanobacteraceae bacterium]
MAQGSDNSGDASNLRDSLANRAGRLLQNVLVIFGLIGSSVVMMGVGYRIANNSGGFLIAMLLTIPVRFLTVWVHEVGHVVAAKRAGMTVLHARVGAIEAMALRTGWRIRWRSMQELRQRKLSGYTIAIPALNQSIRKQQIWFALGGPAANLVLAICSATIGLLLGSNPLAYFFLALCLYSAVVGIGNLIPTRRSLESDGRQALRWIKANSGNSPVDASIRILARSIDGVRPEDQDEADLSSLESKPMPWPLFALYIRLGAHEDRGDWTTATQLEKTFHPLLSEISHTTDLAAIVRTELAFCKTLHNNSDEFLSEDLLPKSAKWSAPHIWPRCLALRAAMAGDAKTRDRELALSLQWAKKSVELSVVSSELLIHEHIRSYKKSA